MYTYPGTCREGQDQRTAAAAWATAPHGSDDGGLSAGRSGEQPLCCTASSRPRITIFTRSYPPAYLRQRPHPKPVRSRRGLGRRLQVLGHYFRSRDPLRTNGLG